MEPIISPWFIYFAGIVNPLKCSMGILSFIGFIAIAIALGAYQWNAPYEGCSDDHYKQCTTRQKGILKGLKIAGIVTLVSFSLNAFVPNRDTMIAMAVANIVTVDNVKGANDFVKSNVQDYVNMIVDAVNKVK